MLLSELSNGQIFKGFVAVRAANIAQTKKGDDYVNLTVFDSSAELSSKIWGHQGAAPIVDSIIMVIGSASLYQGAIQLTINKWRQATTEEYNPADFLPVCPQDSEMIRQQVLAFALSIQDPELQAFTLSLLDKDYFIAPAAQYHHHAYLGGLAQHSLEVTMHALNIGVSTQYQLDRDLLVAGALLHDIGKPLAYSWTGCSITMSEMGRYLEHIILGGFALVQQTQKQPLRDAMVNELLHIIASHHGKLEWGSPIEPITKEAIIIHHADRLSASFNQIDKALSSASKQGLEWTDGRSKVTKYPMKVRSTEDQEITAEIAAINEAITDAFSDIK